MRTKFIFFMIPFLLGFITSTIASQDDTFQVLLEKQLLETELELAKTNDLYFLFNLQDKKIQLKAKGIVLRDWDIETCHFWGNALAIKPLTLIKKSSPSPPKREEIIPVKAEAGPEGQAQPGQQVQAQPDQQAQPASQVEEKKPDQPKAPEVPPALELADMSSIYTILMEGNLRIYIRFKTSGFFPGLNFFRRSLEWSISTPLLTCWYTYKSKPFTLVDIVLKSKEDAQALYWTFTEGCTGIILPPSDYFLLFPPLPPAPDPALSPPPSQEKKQKQKQKKIVSPGPGN